MFQSKSFKCPWCEFRTPGIMKVVSEKGRLIEHVQQKHSDQRLKMKKNKPKK